MTIYTRMQQKHDIEANWKKAKNFIPLEGEIIIYDADENYSYQRIKIGDGTTKVKNLPFDNIQADWNQNDETAPDYVKNRTHYVKSGTINKIYLNNITLQGTKQDSCNSYYIRDFIDDQNFSDFFAELSEAIEITLVVNNELTYTDTLHQSLHYGYFYIGNHAPQDDDFEYRVLFDGTSLCIDLSDSVPQTSTFTLSAIIKKETVVTFDEKFIPDTIARKEDIINLPPYPVTSVNGKTGAVELTAKDVGALSKDTTVPSKTSQLTNDSGYLTSVPSEYVTESELTAKNYALKSEIPSVPVQSVNNKTGLVSLTASDVNAVPTTRTVNNKALSSNITLSASDVGADASGTASSAISTHNANTSAHADIREQISQLSSEKVDKSDITLGMHTDGLFYVFIGGIPVGTGIALPKTSAGDVVGNIDSDKNIVLTGDIPEGTYTVKYKLTDGSLVDIGSLDYYDDSVIPDNPSGYTNMLDVYSIAYNKRWSKSSNGLVDCNGMICITIPVADVWEKTIRLKGFTPNLTASGQSATWYVYRDDNTSAGGILADPDDANLWNCAGLTSDENGVYTLLVNSDTLVVYRGGTKIYANLAVSESAAISESDLADKIITVNQEITEDIPIIPSEPTTSYTNQIPLSINADGTPFVGANGQNGYDTGYRISMSGGGLSAQEGTEYTGFIPVTKDSVIRIKNIAWEDDSTRGVVAYNANFEKTPTDKVGCNINAMFGVYGYDDGNGVRRSQRLLSLANFANDDTIRYIRLCSTDINENSIITVDEEIV